MVVAGLLLLLSGCDSGECPDVVVESTLAEGACPDLSCDCPAATECPDLTCDCPESGGGGDGGRSVVEIYADSDISGTYCVYLSDPGSCCPAGFSMAGISQQSDIPHVVCLEDE